MTHDEVYEELRPLAFSIAYRMLGTVADAEDVVQETFLRYHRAAARDAIDSPKSWVATTATRLAIDQLRSARAKREQYVGEWLPEPLVDSDAAQHAEMADTLSLAFLVLLERLTPAERAAFLLHDVFGYGYDEIARILDRSEAACRQLVTRARRHVDEQRPRFEASRRERDELAARFFAACEDGDTSALVELLAADAVLHGDGGGNAPQLPRPVHGADHVARTLAAWFRLARELGVRIDLADVNGQPGAVLKTPAGEVGSVMALDIADGQVQAVRSVINPEKLRRVGPPVADVRAALQSRRGR